MGLYTELFCAIIPTLFSYFLLFYYPHILLHVYLLVYVTFFSTKVLLKKSTNSHLLGDGLGSGDYFGHHMTILCTCTNNKMASQMKPYFRASLQHLIRLLESCKKVMGWYKHCCFM